MLFYTTTHLSAVIFTPVGDVKGLSISIYLVLITCSPPYCTINTILHSVVANRIVWEKFMKSERIIEEILLNGNKITDILHCMHFHHLDNYSLGASLCQS